MIFHQISDWNDAYANGPNIPGGERWPALFAVRRSAWHALDHAWEIEDRLD